MSGDKTQVTTIDDAPEAAPTPKAKKLAITDEHSAFGTEKVELIIHAGEGELGRQAVFVGINGHGFNIPRDIPVEVTQEVVTQLENCTMTVYEAAGKGPVLEREVRRFAMTVRPIKAKK